MFSNNLNDYEILGHNVGVRPARSAPAGIRLEKETKDGQEIVHAYGKYLFFVNLQLKFLLLNGIVSVGFSAGGYIHSFGAAHSVLELVEDLLLPHWPSKI